MKSNLGALLEHSFGLDAGKHDTVQCGDTQPSCSQEGCNVALNHTNAVTGSHWHLIPDFLVLYIIYALAYTLCVSCSTYCKLQPQPWCNVNNLHKNMQHIVALHVNTNNASLISPLIGSQ